MTKAPPTNLYIYRLLAIKADSGKILFLLYPPIYTLWLLAIGKRLLQRQNKSDKIFTFFASGSVAFFTICFFVAPVLLLFGVDISVNEHRSIPIVLAIYLFWLVTVGLAANITVKYERESTPETYYGLIDNLDYVKRFFGFYFWYLFFWSYQRTVNKFNQ